MSMTCLESDLNILNMSWLISDVMVGPVYTSASYSQTSFHKKKLDLLLLAFRPLKVNYCSNLHLTKIRRGKKTFRNVLILFTYDACE